MGWSSSTAIPVAAAPAAVDGFGVIYFKCNSVADAVLCRRWH